MEPVIDQAFAAALYSDGDAGLDTGASLLAADPATDAELLRRGEEFVRRAWERGWLPADVVRVVRRELDERGAGLAAGLITSEVRRYERLPPRWQSQLDELPPGVPPGRPDRF
ncbi:aromatic acid decarboxylase, partial [Streptomyces laculatispora]|nr:aromatic acid decarboxylase [Streptomyces laculatispora]